MDKVAKVSQTPGLEEVLERDANKKKPGKFGEREKVLSLLQPTPRALDFGSAAVGSDDQRTVSIHNPSQFPVTVIRMSVDGQGFTLAAGTNAPAEIPARGQFEVGVRFQPSRPQSYSGVLYLEIDSAGGRATRVPLKGRATR